MTDEDERPTDAHDAVAAHGLDDEDGVTIRSVGDRLDAGIDVGGFIVDGILGQGGMGTVYSATHPVIGKRAAIKVLNPGLSANPAAVERFVLEARAVNQIGHPNIVDIFAFGKLPDGRSYYVMDLLVGESLRAKIKRSGALHVSEAVSVIDEIASALMAAHDKGIVHRDLKPDNVFMVAMQGRWPEVKLLDWGLLKLTSAQSAVSGGRYRTLAGSVMGTPVYMSPEQARASDQVDTRTDIYALGVVAYELLTGFVPFKKGSSIDTLIAHQEDEVPPLAQKCPSLPDELVQLIEAMLAKNVTDRPTLAAVRAVIKRLRSTKIPSMTAAGLQIGVLPVTPLPAAPLPLPAPPPSRNVPALAVPTPSSPSIPGQSITSLPYQSLHVSAPATQPTLIGHSMPSALTNQQGYARPEYPRPESQPPVSYPQGSSPPQSQPATQAVAASDASRRVIVIIAVTLIVSGIGILILMLT